MSDKTQSTVGRLIRTPDGDLRAYVDTSAAMFGGYVGVTAGKEYDLASGIPVGEIAGLDLGVTIVALLLGILCGGGVKLANYLYNTTYHNS